MDKNNKPWTTSEPPSSMTWSNKELFCGSIFLDISGVCSAEGTYGCQLWIQENRAASGQDVPVALPMQTYMWLLSRRRNPFWGQAGQALMMECLRKPKLGEEWKRPGLSIPCTFSSNYWTIKPLAPPAQSSGAAETSNNIKKGWRDRLLGRSVCRRSHSATPLPNCWSLFNGVPKILKRMRNSCSVEVFSPGLNFCTQHVETTV